MKDFIYNVSIGVGLKKALPLQEVDKINDMFICQVIVIIEIRTKVNDIYEAENKKRKVERFKGVAKRIVYLSRSTPELQISRF